MTLEEKELIPSHFVPHGCDIPYLNSRDYCAAANLFTDIVIQGDSQSRHLQQAMLMAYRGDVIQGGNQPRHPEKHRHFYRCHCDAQFSPSSYCRALDYGFFQRFRPYQLHTCPELPIDSQFTQSFSNNRIGGDLFSFEGIKCSLPDYKGLLVYIQGGVHWKWKVPDVWEKLFSKILTKPILKTCAKQGKLTLIWSGYTAQSPSMDVRFPHQSMEFGLEFEKEMERKLASFQIPMPTLHWIPLTYGSQKADGLHFVTDVNLERAQYVMILAKLLREESKYQSLGMLS